MCAARERADGQRRGPRTGRVQQAGQGHQGRAPLLLAGHQAPGGAAERLQRVRPAAARLHLGLHRESISFMEPKCPPQLVSALQLQNCSSREIFRQWVFKPPKADILKISGIYQEVIEFSKLWNQVFIKCGVNWPEIGSVQKFEAFEQSIRSTRCIDRTSTDWRRLCLSKVMKR